MKAARHRRGNALVEFALGFFMLFTCVAGIFQYGYSMYVYNALEAAVTEGAVFAARATYDTRNNTFETTVKNMAVFGNEAGTGSVLVPGLSAGNIALLRSPASGVPKTVTVRVSSVTVHAVFRNFTFTGKPSAAVRFSGEYFTSE